MSTGILTALAAMRTEAAVLYERTQQSEHPECFACGAGVSNGLGLRFKPTDKGGVTAVWIGREPWISYAGTIHGGLVATILDAAMVHALFVQGLAGRTARLEVRYRRAVLPGQEAFIEGEIKRLRTGHAELQAVLRQDGRVCAEAAATFIWSQPKGVNGQGLRG